MSPAWWAPARRTSDGLPPESAEPRLERARARAAPAEARRGRTVSLRVSGLRPERAEGPVDLTIYGPGGAGDREVVVEATLAIAPGGTAAFTFASDEGDRSGTYVAALRRTDVSSRPVARCTFTLL